VLLVLLTAACAQAQWRRLDERYVAFFGGSLYEGAIGTLLDPASRRDRNWAAGGALGYRFGELWGVKAGAEFSALGHLGDSSLWEAGLVLTAGLPRLPWLRRVPLSLMAGEGVSYCSRVAGYESSDPSKPRELLNLVVLEAAYAPAGGEGWSLLVRLHHRSTVWGLFAPGGDSNFMLMGLRKGF
jgi:hypothetical protein